MTSSQRRSKIQFMGPGIGVYLSLWRDPRYSSLYFPVLLPLCARVSPTNRYANVRGKVGSIMCSLTQSIHFLSYLVFSNQIFQFCSLDSLKKMSTPAPVIFTKMVTRGKPQQKEPLPEEIPLGKQKTVKRAKKVAASSKNTATPKKHARAPALPKSPTPRKKGSAARAEPIHLEGP